MRRGSIGVCGTPTAPRTVKSIPLERWTSYPASTSASMTFWTLLFARRVLHHDDHDSLPFLSAGLAQLARARAVDAANRSRRRLSSMMRSNTRRTAPLSSGPGLFFSARSRIHFSRSGW